MRRSHNRPAAKRRLRRSGRPAVPSTRIDARMVLTSSYGAVHSSTLAGVDFDVQALVDRDLAPIICSSVSIVVDVLQVWHVATVTGSVASSVPPESAVPHSWRRNMADRAGQRRYHPRSVVCPKRVLALLRPGSCHSAGVCAHVIDSA